MVGSLTSLVELEAPLRGVDADRHWTHFEQSHSQSVLIAHGHFLKAFALSRQSGGVVAA